MILLQRPNQTPLLIRISHEKGRFLGVVEQSLAKLSLDKPLQFAVAFSELGLFEDGFQRCGIDVPSLLARSHVTELAEGGASAGARMLANRFDRVVDESDPPLNERYVRIDIAALRPPTRRWDTHATPAFVRLRQTEELAYGAAGYLCMPLSDMRGMKTAVPADNLAIKVELLAVRKPQSFGEKSRTLILAGFNAYLDIFVPALFFVRVNRSQKSVNFPVGTRFGKQLRYRLQVATMVSPLKSKADESRQNLARTLSVSASKTATCSFAQSVAVLVIAEADSISWVAPYKRPAATRLGTYVAPAIDRPGVVKDTGNR